MIFTTCTSLFESNGTHSQSLEKEWQQLAVSTMNVVQSFNTHLFMKEWK